MRDWWAALDPGSRGEWGGAAVATLALGVTVGLAVYSRIAAKRTAYLRLHEALIAPDLQAGRRLLQRKVTGVPSVDRLYATDRDEFDQINRALSMFDVLGLYARRRFVSRRLVEAEWDNAILLSWQPAWYFIESRRLREGGRTLWPHYAWLAKRFGAEVDPSWTAHKRLTLPMQQPLGGTSRDE